MLCVRAAHACVFRRSVGQSHERTSGAGRRQRRRLRLPWYTATIYVYYTAAAAAAVTTAVTTTYAGAGGGGGGVMDPSVLSAMDRDALKKQIENMRYQSTMDRWPLSRSIQA